VDTSASPCGFIWRDEADEKTQSQALGRYHETVPPGAGRPGLVEFEPYRSARTFQPMPSAKSSFRMTKPSDTLWPMEPHTKGKHIVLRSYLDAWLPIMSHGARHRSAMGTGRLVLVDGSLGQAGTARARMDRRW